MPDGRTNEAFGSGKCNGKELITDGNERRCICLFQSMRNQLPPLSNTRLYKVDTAFTRAQLDTGLYPVD